MTFQQVPDIAHDTEWSSEMVKREAMASIQRATDFNRNRGMSAKEIAILVINSLAHYYNIEV